MSDEDGAPPEVSKELSDARKALEEQLTQAAYARLLAFSRHRASTPFAASAFAATTCGPPLSNCCPNRSNATLSTSRQIGDPAKTRWLAALHGRDGIAGMTSPRACSSSVAAERPS